MKKNKFKFKVNYSYILLLPLVELNPSLLYTISIVNINNSYEVNSLGEYNKRIYITFDIDQDNNIINLAIDNKNFIKAEYIDEDICVVSYKIPNEYLNDILLVSIGDYTKTSRDYKSKVLRFFKENKEVYTFLKKILTPTREDFRIKSEELMMEVDISTLTSELGPRFNYLNETFELSNFLKTK